MKDSTIVLIVHAVVLLVLVIVGAALHDTSLITAGLGIGAGAGITTGATAITSKNET